jgi:hypothetical protein
MAHIALHRGFTPRVARTRGQRLASWLVLALALAARVGATVPPRASAKVAPAAVLPATSGKIDSKAEPIIPEVAALRAAARVTPATQSVAAVGQHVTVDSTFQAYYTANAGAQFLGAPLTPAFLTEDGLAQFFANGELVLSAPHPTHAEPGDDAPQDPGAIEWRPLLADLLQLGSTAPVGGDTSTLTYLDLRRAVLASPLVNGATLQATLQATLATGAPDAQDATAQGSVFVAGVESNGQSFGHLIPTTIWSYMQRADVSPQGWQNDFGAPLTEALPLFATVGGTLHRELVQVFTNGAVVMDETAGAEGNDDVSRLPTGLAYLETAGIPTVVARNGAPFWAAHDAAILQNPASGAAEVHVGQSFPLTLAGTSAWVGGALWYGVNWRTPGRSGSGWLAATDGAFVAPDPASPPTAGFDLLSTDLEHYLQQYGARVGAYVYDLTRNAAYSYNSSGLFTVASSVKVPIMLTFLTMTERQGREPNGGEMGLLTTMIENSNNDSAQALWDEVGGGPAVASYLQSVGVSDFHPDNIDGWGWSTISPRSMVRLLTLLHNGQVLTKQDRQLALYLMNHIQADEQNGVGDTAPPGATVEMKDGWVPGPDGLWVMNTTGIVTVGGETYAISVYTDDDDSLQQGWDITRHVCQLVGQLLT